MKETNMGRRQAGEGTPCTHMLVLRLSHRHCVTCNNTCMFVYEPDDLPDVPDFACHPAQGAGCVLYAALQDKSFRPAHLTRPCVAVLHVHC